MCGCLGYSSSVVSEMLFSKVESTEAHLIYSLMCAFLINLMLLMFTN